MPHTAADRVPTFNRDFFDQLYRESPDPWDLETSDYEARKYALTLAALPRRRYRLAFEPGCSVGVLTQLLAARCDRVEAWEPVDSPRSRCRDRIAAAGLADRVSLSDRVLGPGAEIPAADLIVLSEILYYLPPAELPRVLRRVVDAAEPGATVVAAHWRGRDDGMLMTGEEAHVPLRDPELGLDLVGGWRDEEFLIDVYRTPGA